jgi:hypothetical protein
LTSKREILRKIKTLQQRENNLYQRFIEPVKAAGWDSHSYDMTASYVALAHAECEDTLEATVSGLVRQSVQSTNYGHPHPVAINLTLHLSGKLRTAVKLNYSPSRKLLESYCPSLQSTITQLRLIEYWKVVVDGNHGAGSRYVESLMQPLGVKIDKRSFGQLEAVGVTSLMQLPPTFQTELNEITTLRGRAVHTSRPTFAAKVQGSSPLDVRRNAVRGIDAIVTLCSAVVQRIW